MADEILVLEGSRQGNLSTFQVVFLFPITSPAQTGSPPSNVVPTPITVDGDTPDWASTHLTAQEIGGLNGGTLAFVTISFPKDPNLTQPELVAELRKLYVEQQGVFDARYDTRYEHIGVRMDAV